MRPKKTEYLYDETDRGPFKVNICYLEDKDVFIEPVGIGLTLKAQGYTKFSKVKRLSKKVATTTFESFELANKAVQDVELKKKYRIYILRSYILVDGFIKIEPDSCDFKTELNNGEIIKQSNPDIPMHEVKQLTYVDKADGQTKTSFKIAIAFRMKQLPRQIVVDQSIKHVFPFLHEVILCPNCGFYGHTKEKCNRPVGAFCPTCFSRDHKSCNKATFCKHCNSVDHNTNDKNCPERLRQEAVRKAMAEKNVGFNAAKNILNQRAERRRPPRMYDAQQFPQLKKTGEIKNFKQFTKEATQQYQAWAPACTTDPTTPSINENSRKRRRPQKLNEFQRNPQKFAAKPVELDTIKPVVDKLVSTIANRTEFKGQEQLVRNVLQAAALLLFESLGSKSECSDEMEFESADENAASPESKIPAVDIPTSQLVPSSQDNKTLVLAAPKFNLSFNGTPNRPNAK